MGARKIEAEAIPANVNQAYQDNMQSIAGNAYGYDAPASISMSTDAASLFTDFQRQLEPRLTPETGDLDPIIEWASKLAGTILRIAALIATAREQTIPTEIDADDIRAAITFAPYLEAHAWRAFTLMGLTDGDNSIQGRIARKIKQRQWSTFTTRDLRRTIRSGIADSRELEEILHNLADKTHIIRSQNITPSRTHWIVNPAFLENES
jgi:hypothetical protein